MQTKIQTWKNKSENLYFVWLTLILKYFYLFRINKRNGNPSSRTTKKKTQKLLFSNFFILLYENEFRDSRQIAITKKFGLVLFFFEFLCYVDYYIKEKTTKLLTFTFQFSSWVNNPKKINNQTKSSLYYSNKKRLKGISLRR